MMTGRDSPDFYRCYPRRISSNDIRCNFYQSLATYFEAKRFLVGLYRVSINSRYKSFNESEKL